ncbi:MAG: HlyD family efflux transporter periplasmic adaptor subunit [Cyclobacteriaceae bacterium]
MLRKILGIVLGISLLFVAFYVAKSLINSNEVPSREVPQVIKTVYSQSVINGEVPIMVKTNGNLISSRKVEIYSEVQGILLESNKPFKSGQSFSKNDVLLRINSREFYTSLLAQRSSLYDRIAAMMPDLKFDYPDAFERWNNYLKAFDLNQNIKPLPESKTDKERFFINGKQIVTTYYNVKNLEERYEKHVIRAPFDGVLAESLVNAGTLIRPGQMLGEFISLQNFELEVAVNSEYLDIMKVGKEVKLTDLSNQKEWTGTVKRVNGRIDQETQTVNVYIAVSGKGLIEGMYMEAKIAAVPQTNALEINRNLLLNEKEIFIVENDELVVKEISPVHFTENTVIVKGLSNGTNMIIRPVAGGYAGMPVKMVSDLSISKK